MEADFQHFIDAIQSKLQQALPGKAAQDRMSPKLRNYLNITHITSPLQSAVLLLLYPKNGEIYIAYFKRPVYDGPHSGQIAFPGGKAEHKDSSLQETALRETHEEFGISMQSVKILGSLSKLYIPISNMDVTPFIGFIKSTPQFAPNKKEVSYIIETPLHWLTNKSYKAVKTIKRHNVEIDTPMYIFEYEEIWGATAMITSEFEEILNEIS